MTTLPPRSQGRGTPGPHRPRPPLPLLAALLPATLWACDIPTEAPRFQTVWEATLVRDSVSTGDLLPEHVRLLPDGGFVVDSFTTSSEVLLQDVCEFCTCFEGPIPELDIAPYDWRFQLPSRLVEAPVTQGTAEVVVHNEAGFDVLADGDGNEGFIRVALVDTRTGTTADTVRIARPFPDGDSLAVAFDLAGLRLSNALVARISGRTPGTTCDSVDLSLESAFRTDVRLLDVETPEVVVVLSDADLRAPRREVEVPSAVADRLRPGDAELRLDVVAGTRLPAGVELVLSAASAHDRLFGPDAALFTPLLIPASGDGQVAEVRRTFLVDVGALEGAPRIVLDTRSRVLGNRQITLRGTESVSYSVLLHAEIPSR